MMEAKVLSKITGYFIFGLLLWPLYTIPRIRVKYPYALRKGLHREENQIVLNKHCFLYMDLHIHKIRFYYASHNKICISQIMLITFSGYISMINIPGEFSSWSCLFLLDILRSTYLMIHLSTLSSTLRRTRSGWK